MAKSMRGLCTKRINTLGPAKLAAVSESTWPKYFVLLFDWILFSVSNLTFIVNTRASRDPNLLFFEVPWEPSLTSQPSQRCRLDDEHIWVQIIGVTNKGDGQIFCYTLAISGGTIQHNISHSITTSNEKLWSHLNFTKDTHSSPVTM